MIYHIYIIIILLLIFIAAATYDACAGRGGIAGATGGSLVVSAPTPPLAHARRGASSAAWVLGVYASIGNTYVREAPERVPPRAGVASNRQSRLNPNSSVPKLLIIISVDSLFLAARSMRGIVLLMYPTPTLRPATTEKKEKRKKCLMFYLLLSCTTLVL
jgi:hypothetical protein